MSLRSYAPRPRIFLEGRILLLLAATLGAIMIVGVSTEQEEAKAEADAFLAAPRNLPVRIRATAIDHAPTDAALPDGEPSAIAAQFVTTDDTELARAVGEPTPGADVPNRASLAAEEAEAPRAAAHQMTSAGGGRP